jgi:predicted TIM-barrel fold metal-dependent hydrolase
VTSGIPAIDVHGHYGTYIGSIDPVGDHFMSASAQAVADRAAKANIQFTIVSPLEALMPRGRGNAFAANIHAARIVEEINELLQYVVIDPRDPRTFDQADEMLRAPRCVGIKIHPEEHQYPVREFGEKIFEFAAARDAAILTHSSEQYSLAADFVPFANTYPSVRLILAHIGCAWDGDLTHQVRAIQNTNNGNVFADTSSARSVTPGLIEWAVREVGVERVLFGTDTPLYHAGMQRARIDQADLTHSEKLQVLRENAVQLFGLERFFSFR